MTLVTPTVTLSQRTYAPVRQKPGNSISHWLDFATVWNLWSVVRPGKTTRSIRATSSSRAYLAWKDHEPHSWMISLVFWVLHIFSSKVHSRGWTTLKVGPSFSKRPFLWAQRTILNCVGRAMINFSQRCARKAVSWNRWFWWSTKEWRNLKKPTGACKGTTNKQKCK